MTIPRRTDMANGETNAAARTKVLAELPYVGDEPLAPSQVETLLPTSRTVKSIHSAFIEETEFESETPSPRQQSRRRQTRYVDQAHIDHEWEHEEQLLVREDREREGRSRVAQKKTAHRQGHVRPPSAPKSALGAILSDAHEQMAPFAGLIVTAALLVAAGLLFHMMSGSKQTTADLDEFALPGFRVQAGNDSLPQGPTPPLADTTVTPETVATEGMKVEAEVIAEPAETPTTPPPIDTNAAISRPSIEPTVEPSMPLGQLSFPVTSTPLALDYSRALDSSLQQLPAVAERGGAANEEPINR